MDVTHLQLIFMGVIFTVTSAVGLAPVFLRRPLSRLLVSRAATRSRMLSCALCFGAGVFLFVCFMGLLPAADSKFHHFLEELSHTDERWEKFAEFPWGFFVVTCGFLIIFTVDKLVHAADDARRRSTNQTLSTTTTPTTTTTTTTTTTINPGHIQLTHPKHQHHDSSHNEDGGGGGKGVPSSVMFLVALGTHSVFEGVAVGLQTKADKVLEFAVAVLVHEWVMAFTFGLEVVSSNEVLSRCKKVTYILIFTSTIPLGIAVGVGLQNAPSAHREIVSAVLEAFATGIFIHIIFIEVLAKEFPAHHNHNHNHYNHHDYSNNLNHLDPQQELCYHHHNHNNTTTTTPWNQQRATYHHQTYHQEDHQYHNHDYQYHTSNCIHDDNPHLHNHNPLHDDQLQNDPHNQHQLELQQQHQLQNYPHNHQLQQQQQQQNDTHNQLQQYHLNQHQHNTYPLQENCNHHNNTTHQDTSPNHNNHDNRTSETCLILEKIASICCGVSIMIVLNLFLHTHH
ncbi:hypothetical protein Pcinc_035448 [Petrolisthes cinctipes]|uniref:Zinc transporter ZIP3 n=1 Tax=Petrolisthes cinctipes TaxID=88211 RepID=A0AAE1BWY8_PETCI|nr:hypothetical protein Pcinc_035448 [Petrolisthes cinctipes]